MVSFASNEKSIVNHDAISSVTEDLICSARFRSSGDRFRAGLVEIYTEGVIQGVTTASKISHVHLKANSDGVPDSAEVTPISGYGVIHAARIVAGEVQIYAVFPGRAKGISKLTHYRRVVGASLLIKDN